MKGWISDLVNEYPTKRTEEAIVRLARVFQQYDDGTMRRAVDEYMLHERFFPKVSDLKPYIDLALLAEQGPAAPLEEVRQVSAVRMAKMRQEIQYTDDDILAWEIERGTMGGGITADSDDWRAGLISATMPVEAVAA